MRKEIIGILFFFLFVTTLISLYSYNPDDPSLFNNQAEINYVDNLFGLVGAHISGFMIGLLGLGIYLLPVLLLIICVHVFSKKNREILLNRLAGGILLIVSISCLFALFNDYYCFFGKRIFAGGYSGTLINLVLVRYTNITGSVVILLVSLIIGFIMFTDSSVLDLVTFIWNVINKFIIWIIEKKNKIIWQKQEPKKNKSEIRKTPPKKKSSKKTIKINLPDKNSDETSGLKANETKVEKRQEGFKLPSIDLIDDPDGKKKSTDKKKIMTQAKLLENKLEDFGVQGEVVDILPGPVITTFEYEPAPGIKINKIVNLTDDLSLSLSAISIRIVAPIPGKSVVGIEIPNNAREIVKIKEIIVSDEYKKTKNYLPICLGKDLVGKPVIAQLETMPHLLIAGATGTGKSVALNSVICGLLFRSSPEEVKIILIDPKRIELSMYDGIPHLITPVVTDVKKATNALYWAVKEMEKRYKMLAEVKAKNIMQYNSKIKNMKKEDNNEDVKKLPLIVIIIDELSDLMMVASRDVEVALTRLAQMARAAGIHLILATQRPSVDVLTGIIKANFSTRLTFKVSSKIDSRTIIDANGAENLLGKGDMLFMPPGVSSLQRIQGAFISEPEIERIINFLKSQQMPDYNESVTQSDSKDDIASEEKEYDERYDDAIALVTKTRQASISMIQRHLRIGYNRAARIVEVMEKEGIVGPSDGARPREVLVPGYDNIP